MGCLALVDQRERGQLWLAIREVYRWVHGHHGYANSIFERLEKGIGREWIEKEFPYLAMAFDLWRRHKNKDTFFAINNIRPDDLD